MDHDLREARLKAAEALPEGLLGELSTICNAGK
jgi:hypothetical protein